MKASLIFPILLLIQNRDCNLRCHKIGTNLVKQSSITHSFTKLGSLRLQEKTQTTNRENGYSQDFVSKTCHKNCFKSLISNSYLENWHIELQPNLMLIENLINKWWILLIYVERLAQNEGKKISLRSDLMMSQYHYCEKNQIFNKVVHKFIHILVEDD